MYRKTLRHALLWYDMRGLNPTLSAYNIYRKADGDSTFKLIANKFPAGFTSYVDSTIVAGHSYTYAIESTDGLGNTSAKAITNQLFFGDNPIIVPNITAFKSNSAVTITWGETSDTRANTYTIYRYAKGEEPQKLGVAQGTEHAYADKTVTHGKTYYYYIQANSITIKSNKSNNVYIVY